VGRLAAGAVAKKLLAEAGIAVVAYVTELGGITAEIASSDFRAGGQGRPFSRSARALSPLTWMPLHARWRG